MGLQVSCILVKSSSSLGVGGWGRGGLFPTCAHTPDTGSTLPPLIACLCIMSCHLISAKMLAGVRIFSQGDICILIGGLDMEMLLPKAGKPHWEESGDFGLEQGCVRTET